MCCCWYHKGTNFQANHNCNLMRKKRKGVVADTTKVRIFKQITTIVVFLSFIESCCWYHKGTNFQANHNRLDDGQNALLVVADTTKVRIFKQITTKAFGLNTKCRLLLIPQRYEFSSKSQLSAALPTTAECCCWYHKGTNFQANHNLVVLRIVSKAVVADTTKVRIFKQITTPALVKAAFKCCCWYHKGTNFQANHNQKLQKQIET